MHANLSKTKVDLTNPLSLPIRKTHLNWNSDHDPLKVHQSGTSNSELETKP